MQSIPVEELTILSYDDIEVSIEGQPHDDHVDVEMFGANQTYVYHLIGRSRLVLSTIICPDRAAHSRKRRRWFR